MTPVHECPDQIPTKDASLTPEVLQIIRQGATESPYSGTYNNFFKEGTYLCRGCGTALFRGHSKFHTSCGWPSFDEGLTQAITERLDNDHLRTEISCTQCTAHLGHVFAGEMLTEKNKRYCVNSRSIEFVSNTDVLQTEEAMIAGGCFWGVQYYLGKVPGVLLTEVGYTGGTTYNPSYDSVCQGNTGHFEAVRVIFSPDKISYKDLIKYFFEIHNPFQLDGQGPDRGSQYQSAIFYYLDKQKQVASALMSALNLHAPVATQLLPANVFWPAEALHQHYYDKTKKMPYCHTYIKRFKDPK